MRVKSVSHRAPARSRSIGRVASAVTLGVTAAVFLTACSSSGGGSTGDSTGSPVGGSGFYKGKKITYIVPNAPGTAPAQQIVALAPYIEKYLGATVQIQYNSGNSIIGQNQVASAKPDGLTVGELTLQTDLTQLYFDSEKVNFALDKVTYFGSPAQENEILVACAGSKYTSMEQLLTAGEPVSSLIVKSTLVEKWERLLYSAYGIDGKFLTGYTATTQKAGCQRGDGAISGGGVSNFVSADHTAMAPNETPLLLSGPMPDDSPAAFLNDKVPTLTEFAKQHPPTGANGQEIVTELVSFLDPNKPRWSTFGPAGVPQERVDELAAAMKYAASQPEVQKAFTELGIPSDVWVAPADIKSYVAAQLQNVSTVRSLLGT